MRKLLLISLSVLIFGLFAVLGFLSASRELVTTPLEVSANQFAITAQQKQLLIVQVDKLDSSPPRLLSVWIAGKFVSTNQTILTFTQVFPPARENSAFQSLDAAFGLDDRRSPVPAFLNRLKSRGFDWQGYLVLDQTASKRLPIGCAPRACRSSLHSPPAARLLMLFVLTSKAHKLPTRPRCRLSTGLS